jgi:hypothetical protein
VHPDDKPGRRNYAAACLVEEVDEMISAGVIFQFFGYDVPTIVSLPLLPFELTIGAWLLLKGIKDQQ